MDLGPLLANLLSAPVLFFTLGIAAAVLKSDLEIPSPIPKLLSLYLLMSIGLHGGVELVTAGLTSDVVASLAAAIILSAIMPVWVFALLKRPLGSATAAGVAATYGSISAVTFIIATSFLADRGVSYGGHMVAAMALMESPAIIAGILLARFWGRVGTDGHGIGARNEYQPRPAWGPLLHDAFFNGAVFLLLGSLLIGLVIGREGFASVAPFVYEPFRGVLSLFLLDMGLVAARRLGDFRRAGATAVIFGVVAPPVHAGVGIVVARLLGLSPGDALLLAVLAGSASYIAVPAALRLALPQANPSIYLPMSLGVTFPFNVVLGIPLYWLVITHWFN